MVMNFFRGGKDGGLAHIEHEVVAMLGDCRHSFDGAMNAVLGASSAELVADDVRSTDARINAREQQIRRELVVHVSVAGAADVGTVLAYLMITRMLERVGDQAKNVLDLALDGVSFAGSPDQDRIVGYRDEISRMFGTASEVLTERDEDTAHAALGRADELLEKLESGVREQVRSSAPGTEAVPRALLFRYLKRTVANLANTMSAVVLPLDKIDYYGPTIDRDE